MVTSAPARERKRTAFSRGPHVTTGKWRVSQIRLLSVLRMTNAAIDSSSLFSGLVRALAAASAAAARCSRLALRNAPQPLHMGKIGMHVWEGRVKQGIDALILWFRSHCAP
jgi:hypothetical protein